MIKVDIKDQKGLKQKILKFNLQMSTPSIRTSIYLLGGQLLGLMSQYLPFDLGFLERTAWNNYNAASPTEELKLTWQTPYARRLYYGADFSFNRISHPNAQAFWDRPITDNKILISQMLALIVKARYGGDK